MAGTCSLRLTEHLFFRNQFVSSWCVVVCRWSLVTVVSSVETSDTPSPSIRQCG